MKVKIRNTNGSPDILVEATPVTSMIQLVGDIARQLNIQSDRIRLIFNGQLLVANSDNLQRHNIMEGSVLHCVPRPINVPPSSPAPPAAASQSRPAIMTQNSIIRRHHVSQHQLETVGLSSSRGSSSSTRAAMPMDQYQYDLTTERSHPITRFESTPESQRQSTRATSTSAAVATSSSSGSAPRPSSAGGFMLGRNLASPDGEGRHSATVTGASAASTPSSLVATDMFGREIERAMGNLRSTAESIRRYLTHSLFICTSLIHCLSPRAHDNPALPPSLLPSLPPSRSSFSLIPSVVLFFLLKQTLLHYFLFLVRLLSMNSDRSGKGHRFH